MMGLGWGRELLAPGGPVFDGMNGLVWSVFLKEGRIQAVLKESRSDETGHLLIFGLRNGDHADLSCRYRRVPLARYLPSL